MTISQGISGDEPKSSRPNSAVTMPFGKFTSWVKHLFSGRKLFSFNLRIIILSMMLGVSVVPILLFYKWVEYTSFQREIASVDENHLIIAKNLSAALSRYAVDLKTTFDLIVQNEDKATQIGGFQDILRSFEICQVSIYDADNQQLNQIMGVMRHESEQPSAELLVDLRALASKAGGETVISGIQDYYGKPHFFTVKLLNDNRLAVAPWEPGFLVALQKSIAFGERGHSMIVDQFGRVVAHPNAEWQARSKDASGLPVVAAMMAQNTGVMQFLSPPLDADMIAGYTFVPETGWGVMVPQPVSELVARAKSAQSATLIFAAFEIFLAVLLSVWLSSLLAEPLLAIVASARRLTRGDFQAHVPSLPKRTPVEIKLLAANFNRMVDQLSRTTSKLNLTLSLSEEVAKERAELLISANQANELKSQFVSMVSHELRTPLTSIKGALELLDEGMLGELPPAAKDMIRIAAKNSRRLAIMINDLLDLEKLESREMRYKLVELDLNNLLDDALESNKSFGDLNGVTYIGHNLKQPTMIKGDHNRLMQVMANLLSNAAKFSATGSEIDVKLETTDTHARISVKDRGIGISDADKDKVFEKFVQLEATDSRRFGGSGLGLGIARVIVEKHGGKIDFISQEGEGTTFFFDLPLDLSRGAV